MRVAGLDSFIFAKLKALILINCCEYFRSAVRHFGVLAQKNHLVFVEALFQHPNPHNFCEQLHHVYEDTARDTEVSLAPEQSDRWDMYTVGGSLEAFLRGLSLQSHGG